MKKQYLLAFLLSLFTIPMIFPNANAESGNRAIIPEQGSPFPLRFSFAGDVDFDNTVGYSKMVSQDTHQKYRARLDCTNQQVLYPRDPIYFEAISRLNIGHQTNYYAIDDYFDIMSRIYIGGGRKDFFTIPFDRDNGKPQGPVCIYSKNPITDPFSTGSKGQFTFYLKKKILNGEHITNIPIAYLYSKFGAPSFYDETQPLVEIILESIDITVADSCSIDPQQDITVAFGDVRPSELDKGTIDRTTSLHYKCANGSEGTTPMKVRFSIQSNNPASFNPSLFGTNTPSHLGVLIETDGKKIITPNGWYNLTNNEGDLTMTYKLTKEFGSRVELGDFSASATLVFSLQ